MISKIIFSEVSDMPGLDCMILKCEVQLCMRGGVCVCVGVCVYIYIYIYNNKYTGDLFSYLLSVSILLNVLK